jgi:very-short-patch-repair endonuclease
MSAYDSELVQKHKEYAIQARLDEDRIDLDGWIDARFGYQETTPNSDYGPPIESPLEGVFLVWWEATFAGRQKFHVKTQFEISIPGVRVFRADFAVFPIAMDRWHETPLLVEVDGHAFHEKTKEQVTYRNERDRLLQLAGYSVLHFSYSELTQHPAKCIGDVANAALMRFDPEFRRVFGPKLGQ